MKKILILTMMLCACIVVSAQTKKEQRAAAKRFQQQVNALVSEGWKVSPGQPSIYDQQTRANKFQSELDEEGLPKYVWDEGRSIGKNYDAAKMQALEVAKQNIARKLQSDVAGIIESDMSNEQLEPGEAESVTRTILESTSFFNQRLGRVITLMECYRVLPNKNTEVLVMVAYDSKRAIDAAKQEVRKNLEERGKKLREKLDAMISNDK